MSDDQPGWAAPGSADPGRQEQTSTPGRPGDPARPDVPAPPSGYPPAGGSVPTYDHYRPGIVPLRPLTMSDIFGGATLAIRGNPAATLGLGLVSTLVFVVPATALGAVFASRVSGAFSSEEIPELGDLLGALGANFPSLAAAFAVFLMSAFTAHVIGEGVLGRKTSLAQTWQSTKGRLWAVVGSAVLIMLLVGLTALLCLGGPLALLVYGAAQQDDTSLALGVLLLLGGILAVIAGALFVGTRFSFVASAIVLERLGVRGGFKRSWRLTAGSAFWRILGIRLLVGLLVVIVSAILSVPITQGFQLGMGAGDVGFSGRIVGMVFAGALSTVVTGALTTPFSAGTDTLLYIDQRMRREGLDTQLVTTARASGA